MQTRVLIFEPCRWLISVWFDFFFVHHYSFLQFFPALRSFGNWQLRRNTKNLNNQLFYLPVCVCVCVPAEQLPSQQQASSERPQVDGGPSHQHYLLQDEGTETKLNQWDANTRRFISCQFIYWFDALFKTLFCSWIKANENSLCSFARGHLALIPLFVLVYLLQPAALSEKSLAGPLSSRSGRR